MNSNCRIFFLVVLLAGIQGCKSQSSLSHLDDNDVDPQPEEPTILPIQEKYGEIIGVPPEKVTNLDLYEFIESWIGTPYKMGGEDKAGIDCSFFVQYLYHDVYNKLIERTAERQFMSPDTDKFRGQEYLQEGDLLFFNSEGAQYLPITHVGVYLDNQRFVHAASNHDAEGHSGVQISNLSDSYWQKMFVAAGRKPINTSAENN
ncbi:C40 family peptidase [Fulvivirga sediminis]|uniref:C40 family peptidase n=1 Tax=Fulvivirga sediminis TaxID=2803949 RepID=A0A937K0U9_9BACT|nr:C40 family peptidase [Fulvivirga sediminis]MBL3656756.1 C40 family peptidase [Fulvivirga sediminis]